MIRRGRGRKTASTDRVINYRGRPLSYPPHPAPRPAYNSPPFRGWFGGESFQLPFCRFWPIWGVANPTSHSSNSNPEQRHCWGWMVGALGLVGLVAAPPPRSMATNLHSNLADPGSCVWFGPVAAPQPRRVAGYANTHKALGLCSRGGLQAMQN